MKGSFSLSPEKLCTTKRFAHYEGLLLRGYFFLEVSFLWIFSVVLPAGGVVTSRGDGVTTRVELDTVDI